MGYLLSIYSIIFPLLLVRKREVLYFLLISFSVVAFFREFGTNTGIYKEIIQYIIINNSFPILDTDIGFLYIIKFLAFFISDYRFLFFIFFFASFYFRYRSYSALTNGIAFCMLYYMANEMFVKDYGQIRNGLSSTLMLLFLSYDLKNKKWISRITLAISSVIHISSLSVLLYSFLKKISFKHMLSLILVSTILGFLIGNNYYFLENIPIVGDRIITYQLRMASYLQDGLISPIYQSLIYWKYVAIICLVVTCKPRIEKIVLNFYLTGFVFMSLFIQNPVISGRLGSLFYSVEPIIVYTILQRFKEFQSLYLMAYFLLMGVYIFTINKWVF